MMKLIRFSLILLLSLLAASALAANKDMSKLRTLLGNKTKMKNQITLLFIQQANSGSLVPIKNKKYAYQLILNNVKKKTLYFSDQPKRVVGSLSTAAFIAMIADNKKHYSIMPNVAIQGYRIKNGKIIEINRIAVLSNPKYNSKTKTVTYSATLLGQAKFKPLKHHLMDITLFFDNIRPWPP